MLQWWQGSAAQGNVGGVDSVQCVMDVKGRIGHDWGALISIREIA